MKKTTVIIIISFLFTSCDLQYGNKEEQLPEKVTIEEKINEIPVNKVEVIVYDGCEYIVFEKDNDSNSSYGFMAHKGNCSNPIHKHK